LHVHSPVCDRERVQIRTASRSTDWRLRKWKLRTHGSIFGFICLCASASSAASIDSGPLNRRIFSYIQGQSRYNDQYPWCNPLSSGKAGNLYLVHSCRGSNVSKFIHLWVRNFMTCLNHFSNLEHRL
jgi:hypothetical protein